MSVREATTDDVDAIARIHVEASRAAERGLLPDAAVDAVAFEPRQRMWGRIVGDPDHPVHVLVAEDRGTVVGFAACGPVTDAADAGELQAIYVDPPAQGSGHGSVLLDAVEAELRERGFAEAILWVLDRNAPTIGFYEDRGWRDDGVDRTESMHGAAVTERRYRKRLR